MIKNPYPKFCKSKIFLHSLPAHPRYRTGIMLQNMQKRLYLHVYILHFVYLDHGGQDNHGR